MRVTKNREASDVYKMTDHDMVVNLQKIIQPLKKSEEETIYLDLKLDHPKNNYLIAKNFIDIIFMQCRLMSTAVDPAEGVYNTHAYITVVVQRRSVCRIRTSGINKLDLSHNNSYHYH